MSGFVRDVLVALFLCGAWFVFFGIAGTWFPEGGEGDE